MLRLQLLKTNCSFAPRTSFTAWVIQNSECHDCTTRTITFKTSGSKNFEARPLRPCVPRGSAGWWSTVRASKTGRKCSHWRASFPRWFLLSDTTRGISKSGPRDWELNLNRFLDQAPAGVGEVGLDRWIKDFDLQDQERVFVTQLRIAAERDLPLSIHCLQAWGRLLEVLQAQPRPRCGFLLHSFGGPREMIPALSRLGAYLSLPGYYAHDRKARQREAFKTVPLDRLLLETDAPDQPLPLERVRYRFPMTKRANR